jgi:hypothetical protein
LTLIKTNLKEYYSILNSSLKSQLGMASKEISGFFNEGYYLNPENTVPNAGLTSLGISVPLGQGFYQSANG